MASAFMAVGLALPAAASTAGAHGMDVNRVNQGRPSHGGGGGSVNLTYHGGAVATAPVIYVVFWGSQWNGNDPSGEASYLVNFYKGISGAETWSASTTQYCQGVAFGSTSCANTSASNLVGHPATSPLVDAHVWYDNGSAAPSAPSQSQLAAEAARAAATQFHDYSASAQYVIATAHGNNASGFGTQYCAWHSSTSTSGGTLAYTNLPYMSDAGASCGQNFVNRSSGLLDGVSIVGGHEYAETITDAFPNGGWLDGKGAENGDKCAWISPGSAGGAKNVLLATGSFPVQSLWSNSFNGGAGGCVISYTNSSTQSQF